MNVTFWGLLGYTKVWFHLGLTVFIAVLVRLLLCILKQDNSIESRFDVVVNDDDNCNDCECYCDDNDYYGECDDYGDEDNGNDCKCYCVDNDNNGNYDDFDDYDCVCDCDCDIDFDNDDDDDDCTFAIDFYNNDYTDDGDGDDSYNCYYEYH